MGFYGKWLFPRVLDLVMQQQQMIPFRRRIGEAATGRVLDVGIGSGLNLPFYGSQADGVVGIDPSPELLHLAEERAHKASPPVELRRASGEALPIADQSIDTAVVTFTLCTVDNAATTLAEIRRVLRPGGKLLFAEHGRAPETGIVRWQNRLTPIWRRIAGGCHLNRKPDDLIRAAGFSIEDLEAGYLKGPRPMAFVTRAVPTRADTRQQHLPVEDTGIGLTKVYTASAPTPLNSAQGAVIEIMLIGIIATLATDLWQKLLQLTAGFPEANWGLIGRWVVGFSGGRFAGCRRSHLNSVSGRHNVLLIWPPSSA